MCKRGGSLNGTQNAYEKRRDIVFKSVLRKIKKDFKADFYHHTQYDRTKRSRSPLYYYKCLRLYVEHLYNTKNVKLSEEFLNQVIYNLGKYLLSPLPLNLSLESNLIIVYRMPIIQK